jgi:hypothetical protein
MDESGSLSPQETGDEKWDLKILRSNYAETKNT